MLIGPGACGGAEEAVSCERLAQCCGQLGEGTASCLSSLAALEGGDNAERDCRLTLSSLSSDGQCLVGGDGSAEGSAESCADGLDNDGNGFADCGDWNCSRQAEVCGASEDTRAKCTDGVDNDGDQRIDCADPNCALQTQCSTEENTNLLCSDGIDNDGNGFFDCRDNDCNQSSEVTVCGSDAIESGPAACRDGIDNDSNGFIDCRDNNCKNDPRVSCP